MSTFAPPLPVPAVSPHRPYWSGGRRVGRPGAVPARQRWGLQWATRWLLCWLLLGCGLALGVAPGVAQAAGPLAGRTIVLDPEEGGSNPGSVIGSVAEKTINLTTALDVGALLRQAGASVVFTRTTDVAVSLPARAALANQVHADAFVTLAANGLNDPAISGVVTFYGGPAGYAGGQTRGAALVEQGRVLAQAVQAGVVQTTGAVDRGVQPADFYVLGYTQMPSILIETGFLTNPAEAQRLASLGYEQAIAQGIVAGLGRFFAGPASTVGAPSARGAVAGASAGPGRYTVQPGDTLSGLAARVGVSVATLLQDNGLRNANTLQAGQTLTLPTGGRGTPVLGGGATTTPGLALVQPGDTLSGLALHLGVPAALLARLNGLANANVLRAGQTLRLPAAGASGPPPAAAAPAGAATYTVQPGDTLSGLALRFGLSVTTLLQDNGLPNANTLLAGQILHVPAAGLAAGASGPGSAPSLPSDSATYTVQPGDTLSGIALRLGVSPETLARLNRLPNQDRLLAETTLRVPG